MDEKLKKVKTANGLVMYLAEHSMENAEYDPESREYIMSLVQKMGLSKSVLRTHYDIRKK
ncbi:hypothetical protein [Cuneatibacter caecimuris]|uniref:Uncharacterized protein n=1 Tax=Cuneatibacter caecimuris TaxID=1796618 RepID=A0A4Q7PN65_9FIRM|nr:hypothetical protein [Cuneatibacter caecimuris]RZT02304.1 hypothetical protein EV209_0415 [Cuneatibacter caecimuris]